MDMDASQPADIVRAVARAFERDRYLAALLAPAHAREDLVTLAAFAGEIARIPAAVSEPMMGKIRLQWWRDAFAAAYADAGHLSGHPVADALAALAHRRSLPRAVLDAIVDAQMDRLDDRPFETLDELRAHLAVVDGGHFALAWRTLGGAGAPPPLLGQAGEVYGLARCLIEVPAELAQGRVVLPRRLLAEHGLESENLQSSATATKWRILISALCATVADRLDALAPSYRRADARARLAALPLALVRPYLKATQRGEVAGLEANDIGPLSRVWRIWRCRQSRRV